MAQSKILLAFRARLRTRGYRDIKITTAISPYTASPMYDDAGNPMYCVSCIEPLIGWYCCFAASEPQMANWPSVPFTHSGYFSFQTSLDDEEALFL